MSHIASVSPAGPLTLNAGQTQVIAAVATTKADESFAIDFTASDGSHINVVATVDRPDAKLIFGGTAPLAENEVRVTSTGGAVAAVSGQPLQVSWTMPA